MDHTHPLPLTAIQAAVHHHVPGRTVQQVEYRGLWIRHNYRIILDGGEPVYLKVDDDFDASAKEAFICSLFREHHLPAPQVLALDDACRLLPAPFIVQAHAGGLPYGRLLDETPPAGHPAIYRALGQFYRRLHAVTHPHSGWIIGTGEVLPYPPAGHQYQEVILKLGGEAVDRGLLSSAAHARLQDLWSAHLPYLNDHIPALVAGALHWTVYLEPHAAGPGVPWRVSKLTDLHDVLFWDPAWDLAQVRYPTFRPALDSTLWDAFLSAYAAPPPDDLRLKLYALLQHLDAALGSYMEPPSPSHERWKTATLANFETLLDL